MGKERDKLTNGELLELYLIYRETERDMANVRATYVNFYLTLSFLLLGGILTIYTTVGESTIRWLAMLFLSVSVVVFSFYFYGIAKNLYRNQMEYIAMCAHIEDLLELSNPALYGGKTHWKEEGIMIARHTHSRGKSKNKQEFVDTILGNRLFSDSKGLKGFFKTTQINHIYAIHLAIGFTASLIGVYAGFKLFF